MMRRVALVAALAAMGVMLMAGTAQAHKGFCVETTNPHGQNVPPAGSTTLPGPRAARTKTASTRSAPTPGRTSWSKTPVAARSSGRSPAGQRSSTRRLRARAQGKRRSEAPTVRPERSSTTSPARATLSSSPPGSPTTGCSAASRRLRSKRIQALRGATAAPLLPEQMDTARAMSQNDPIKSQRTIEERVGIRWPSMARRMMRWVLRLPPGSRVRRAMLRRTARVIYLCGIAATSHSSRTSTTPKSRRASQWDPV